MKYVKGFTFGYLAQAGGYADDNSKQSMRLLKQQTACDTVILALGALQETAQSEMIDYTGPHMPTDTELCEMIAYAQSLSLRVFLKPLVNCKDGTWRAHINFFDVDVPHEPQWKNWFQSYTAYQSHYAIIAQKMGCEMLIVGCEMVQAQRKETYWRELIAKVREIYTGLISYNTDKYQEEYVTWWDAVDVISSSGYYPIIDWDTQLTRIQQVVMQYKKPFFFAEAGCPSRHGSSFLPNDWTCQGSIDIAEQAEYYRVLFQKAGNCDWLMGFSFWDWKTHLYQEADACKDADYAVYGKPACNEIFKFYSRHH